jgi:putative Holliday junction resolvase
MSPLFDPAWFGALEAKNPPNESIDPLSALSEDLSADDLLDDDSGDDSSQNSHEHSGSGRSSACPSHLKDANKATPGVNSLVIPPHLRLESWAHTVSSGPFLGLDWGKARCGIALSDPDNCVAMPIKVCAPGGPLRHTLVELWNTYQCRAIIIGWPLHSSGDTGSLCAPIERLAQRLSQDHGWPTALWDERLTTQGARAWMCDSKTVMDDHAAAFILQGGLLRWQHLIQSPHP